MDFADTTYGDFLLSAAAIAPLIEDAPSRGVGQIVLDGIRATRQIVRHNTNLGMLLLLAPLAAVPRDVRLRDGIEFVLDGMTISDSRGVFEAIRLAKPGGLGRVSQQDVDSPPTLPLRAVMRLAADHDMIARQYANGFREVLDDGVSVLEDYVNQTREWESAIIGCFLELMARHPDSLIARKRGTAEAAEAGERARRVLNAGWPFTEAGVAALTDFDTWLRAYGNSRNPGTTADLVTACLFAGLREGSITLPSKYPWSISGR
jgi:triphosphoribosyl-dephospho-CoA synthase